MQSRNVRALAWALGLAVVASATPLAAQPSVRDHRPGPAARDRRPTEGPREAPPPPRSESPGTRAGFVWIAGHWEWRGGKYEWVAGHWERERAGKRWQEGRWEQRGDRWTYQPGRWGDADVPPPTPTPPPVTTPPSAPGPRRPRQPPPAPRAETPGARAGFVWIAGHWEWRADQYAWVEGHWERERAGKRWRPARWEARDGEYAMTPGDWIDDATPPVTPDRPARPDRRRQLERPIVSSYWPIKGKPGTRIVIRGKNFPTDTTVVWAGQPVSGAKVRAEQIVFAVPAGAASGAIALRVGGRRALPVGAFEVAAAYDPEAERKRIEEERRKQAEAAWAARQAQLAKDKAAREAAARARERELVESRERRRAERADAIRAKWERAFLADEETQAELALHAQRGAQLARMALLAEQLANGKLAVRIEVARSREDDRHQQRMAALRAAFGGTP